MSSSFQDLAPQISFRLRSIFQPYGVSDLKCDDLSVQLVAAALESRSREQSELLRIRLTPSGSREVVHFNPKAAATLILSLLSGVVGQSNPVVLGSAILVTLLTVGGLKTTYTEAEAVLLTIVALTSSQAMGRNEMQDRFASECDKHDNLERQDFEPALHSLQARGIIRVETNVAMLTEKVIVTGSASGSR